jgi:Mn2+/Fe2+ NRAMP family transporter
VNRRIGEAPIFYFLYTLLIAVGAGVVLIPGFNLVRMTILSQVLNGMLLPFVLIPMVMLINKRDLMHEWVNSRWFNLVSWVTVVIMVGLTLAYAGFTLRGVH